jgi:hypothetical protein
VEDILLLKILTSELTPGKNQLNTDDGCQTWLANHAAVASAVCRALVEVEAHAREDHWTDDATWLTYGPWCQQHIKAIRSALGNSQTCE